jgi:hypothetical protein
MGTSFCTGCGEILQGKWKHCPRCGAVNSNHIPIEPIDSPPARETSPNKSIGYIFPDRKTGFVLRLDRNIAFKCALRWALVGGVIVWVLAAFFSPVKATYSTQTRLATGAISSVATDASCPNGFNDIFNDTQADSRTAEEERACVNAAKFVWLADAVLSALIWFGIVLGIGYLINRNRLKRNDSLWFPYRRKIYWVKS